MAAHGPAAAHGLGMRAKGRRRFMGTLAALPLGAAGAKRAEAQAPAKTAVAEDHRELGRTLRAMNDAAGLGVTADEIDRAEAYVTGSILEARAKLRPLVLDESPDRPVAFPARQGPGTPTTSSACPPPGWWRRMARADSPPSRRSRPISRASPPSTRRWGATSRSRPSGHGSTPRPRRRVTLSALRSRSST